MKILRSSERFEKHWSVRKILEMLNDGEINDNIDIQRPYVWKKADKKSALIRSIILNRAIPPLYFNKINEVYDLEDGKQRILTIDKFVKNEFKLSSIETIPVTNENGELEELNLNGCTFDDLPEELQNAIKEYDFTINFTDDAPQEEVADTFFNLNNGQAINAATMNRVKAKSKKQIFALGKHEIFKEALSKTALDGHVNEDLVIKVHAMLYEEEPCLETKWIRPYMKDVEITDEQISKINEILNRIKNVHGLIEDKKVAKRIYVKTHMISIVPIVERSIEENRTDSDFAGWFSVFYNGKKSATNDSIYNSYAGAGSSKTGSVKKRLEQIEKSYEGYFRKDNSENNLSENFDEETADSATEDASEFMNEPTEENTESVESEEE